MLWSFHVGAVRRHEVRGLTFALAIEKGIPASEIASRVYAYPTFHADLKFLV